ncbi:MAG: hypothetical protein FGF53_08475 [Candidatus Brockarchaeota archaeon]|nr:hypothetical protein [Candidatus Brockarchaeota archaeon]
MNKVNVVRVTLLLLSIGVVLAPIVLALDQYDWDLASLITPSYSPPKVDFRMGVVGVRVEDGELYVVLRLTNLGEVQLKLESLNATAYGPDGGVLAPVMLTQAVVSVPNSTEDVILKFNLVEDTVGRLLSYFRDRDRVSVEVSGDMSIEVFGSIVTAPLKISFQLSLEDVKALA